MSRDSRRKRIVTFVSVLALFQTVPALLRGQQFPIVSPEHKELFVDDHLIGKLVNLERTLHQPVKHGPMLLPQKPWENLAVQTRNVPFWVPDEKVWKLYYMAFARKGEKEQHTTSLAISKDGLHWEKPVLNLVEWDGSKANNLVARHESSDQFLYHALYDPVPRSPGRIWRYKRGMSPSGYRTRRCGNSTTWPSPGKGRRSSTLLHSRFRKMDCTGKSQS